MQAKSAKAQLLMLLTALHIDRPDNGLLLWCQLLSAWLLHTATGASPSTLSLPLTGEPPTQWKMLPEYLLLDLAAIVSSLHLHGQLQGRDAKHADDIALACTTLMASPAYVQNPYTRYKLAEVIHTLSPVSSASSRTAHRCGLCSVQMTGTFAALSALGILAVLQLQESVPLFRRSLTYLQTESVVLLLACMPCGKFGRAACLAVCGMLFDATPRRALQGRRRRARSGGAGDGARGRARRARAGPSRRLHRRRIH